MSWQDYIDQMTAEKISLAGIFSTAGDLWGSTPQLTRTTKEEVQALLKQLKADSDVTTDTSFKIGGMKFMRISFDGTCLKLKFLSNPNGDEEKKYLVEVYLCHTCLIIAGTDGVGERGGLKHAQCIHEYLKGLKM